MATGFSYNKTQDQEPEKDPTECAICLQPYVFPAELPCGHVFCFLCIKGTANQSKKCAMCRQEIPHGFIENPNILKDKVENQVESFEGSYQWYYEGRNGWWQYDERTSKELEQAYKAGERTCELLIAGFLYVMDFDAMVQLRRNDPSRRRRMKRDLVTIEKKGVAGLKYNNNQIDTQPREVIPPVLEHSRIRIRNPEGVAGIYHPPTLVPIDLETDSEGSMDDEYDEDLEDESFCV